MELRYVKDYLKKLGSLSEMELEQHDLYLRGLNLGLIQGPMTGNVYLDKPYTKWYREKIVDLNPYETLYNNFVTHIKGRENEIAIVQPDTKRVMTYGEILEQTDRIAAGMAHEGIGVNSNVGMFFSNSIEEAIFLLACSKLGATSKWIDYTKDPEALFASVTEARLDMLAMEDMLKPLEAMINPGKTRTIICGNTGELADHHMTYETLQEVGRGTKVTPVPFDENRASVIISSSGTTGEAKPIVHSDLHINFAARKMMYSNYPLDENHIVMLTIPPHIGLGLITSLYTNLVSGAKLAMIHCNGPEDSMHQTVGFLMNYNQIVTGLYQNPDLRLVIFGAPIHVRIIASVKELQDLSFIDGFLAAGSKISEEELNDFEMIYDLKGYKYPISNGYGQNEMAGAVAINDPIYNTNGAAGYPVIGSTVIVVDEKTGELLEPGVQGKIYERCNSRFLEYYNMPEETQEAFVMVDGVPYFDTKDLGYLNEQGFLFITGRTSRVLIRFDTKITLDKIEGKVRNLPFVKDCAATVIDAGGSFEKLALFVEPEEGMTFSRDEFLARAMEMKLFSDIDKPDFVGITKVPYMNNGKVNYQLLNSILGGQTRTRKSDN